jgi:Na+/proline symporter
MKYLISITCIVQFLPVLWIVTYFTPCRGWAVYPGIITIGALSAFSGWIAWKGMLVIQHGLNGGNRKGRRKK